MNRYVYSLMDLRIMCKLRVLKKEIILIQFVRFSFVFGKNIYYI